MNISLFMKISYIIYKFSNFINAVFDWLTQLAQSHSYYLERANDVDSSPIFSRNG